MKEDRELEQFRRLMPPPTSFADGFDLKSVIGCLFIGLVMMPASMYLSLLQGGELSSAARWVTVILFVELARRSFTTLKRPEIFILFYMAGAAVASPFSGLLWTQYYVQSEPARGAGIAEHIPSWVAPGAEVLSLRTFFHPAWLAPIAMLVMGNLLARIDNFGLGYVLFRLTSDVEKLPFPMAPVGAMGVTALAESSSGEQTWRWRVFSIGGMIGLVFGFLYVGIPAFTSTVLKQPIQILPITFVDLTTTTETLLPGVPMALSLDLGHFMVGLVLPFYAIVGSVLGLLVTWIVNPVLYHNGLLPHYHPGSDAVTTAFGNTVDAYLSIGIGLSAAIAIIGFYHVISSLRQRRDRVSVKFSGRPAGDAGARTGNAHGEPVGASASPVGRPLNGDAASFTPEPETRNPEPVAEPSAWQRLRHPPAGRGDIPLWVGLAIYLFSTTFYTVLCHYLVPSFPLWILIGYGFVYTPIISYVAARMEGIAGQWVDIPMVREATFILSQKFGYHGVDIWFAPIPIHNYAGTVVGFRTQELTGTKFTSVIKAELVIFPVVILSSIVFSQYLWRIAPIPSAVYPYANQMWELSARNIALTQSATLGANSMFYTAIKWKFIAGAAGVGLGTYALLAAGGAPVMLCYGLVRGLGTGLAAGLLPQLIGALVGRYYFQKKFGVNWGQYAPVLLAGFSCGMGLVGMFALGCVLISKAVFQLPY